MHLDSSWFRLSCCLLLTTLFGLAWTGPASGQAPDVERIVSLPKIDGTAPARPTWSGDGTQLAFLWNDHGMPFLDLWLAPPDDEPRRLTFHAPEPDSVLGPGEDLSLEALQARASRRAALPTWPGTRTVNRCFMSSMAS
jgi:hypothetical protein